MAEYVAGRGTTGLAATAAALGGTALAGVLSNGGGILGGLFGGGNVCHENMPINRYEAQQSARIAELETEVKLRDANTFTMSEMGKLRDYVDSKFAAVHEELCQQRVFNATSIATTNCLSGQVAQLMSLTKLVVPNSSICPGWNTTTTA